MATLFENELLIFGAGDFIIGPGWYIEKEEDEDIKRFRKIAKGKNGCLDFENFIPNPHNFKMQSKIAHQHFEKSSHINKDMSDEEIFEYFKKNKCSVDGHSFGLFLWYIESRGINWNFLEPRLRNRGSTLLDYCFNTLCFPPKPVIMEMGRMFPELYFNLFYSETGTSFRGNFIVDEGKVIQDQYTD